MSGLGALLLTLSGFGALGLVCYVCYHAGKSDATITTLQNKTDTVAKAVAIRDRLSTDADYADRVRNRFKR